MKRIGTAFVAVCAAEYNPPPPKQAESSHGKESQRCCSDSTFQFNDWLPNTIRSEPIGGQRKSFGKA
jgi:hypothetical protein